MTRKSNTKTNWHFTPGGIAAWAAISEVPFLFLRETARPPEEITLVIPKGRPNRLRAASSRHDPRKHGVCGRGHPCDQERGSVDHKLGQLWIPANSSAQLSLDQEENFAYECSFQPGNYFGLDVNEPLTMGTGSMASCMREFHLVF
jgi:hypothetical protein